jgi:hypothetical protein
MGMRRSTQFAEIAKLHPQKANGKTRDDDEQQILRHSHI